MSRSPLSFSTPPAAWHYAVALPVDWGNGVDWAQRRDGVIRIHVEVAEGRLSALAVCEPAMPIVDEVRLGVTSGPMVIELVCAPLAACRSIIFRNGLAEASSSRATVHKMEWVNLGPSDTGEDLTPPDGMMLKAVDEWSRYYGDTGSALAERRRIVRYRWMDRVKRMAWLENLQVSIYPNDDLSKALYVSGLYEPNTMLVLRRLLAAGATFIDVGANVGLFSMIAARWVGTSGRVYSFEPSRREFGRLVDHLKLNALQNVVPVRLATSDREGTARLRVARFPNAGHNTLGDAFAYPTVNTDRIETVRLTTLDEFARQYSLERVDVIKLDIEGGEYATLAGASDVLRRFRPVLIVEIAPSALAAHRSSPERVLQQLRTAEYGVYRIGPAAELVALGGEDAGSEGNVVAVPAERHLS